MKVIGLTGGIASGKTTVSTCLRRLGATVVDADVIAREVVAPDTPGLAAVVAVFGTDVLTPDGALNRRRLGDIVFADADARARLNGIVHPLVRTRMQAEMAAAAEAGLPAIVLDIPLLYEGGLEAICDVVWVVTVTEAQQLARLQQRDGLDTAAAKARIAAQMPLQDKVVRADIVIDNSGTMAETEAQVRQAWTEALQGHAAP